jgi:hypothetical protein
LRADRLKPAEFDQFLNGLISVVVDVLEHVIHAFGPLCLVVSSDHRDHTVGGGGANRALATSRAVAKPEPEVEIQPVLWVHTGHETATRILPLGQFDRLRPETPTTKFALNDNGFDANEVPPFVPCAVRETDKIAGVESMKCKHIN